MVLTNGGIDLTHERVDMLVDHPTFVGGVDTLTQRLSYRLDRSVAVAHLALLRASRITVAQIRAVQDLTRVPGIVRQDPGGAHEGRDLLIADRLHHRLVKLPNTEREKPALTGPRKSDTVIVVLEARDPQVGCRMQPVQQSLAGWVRLIQVRVVRWVFGASSAGLELSGILRAGKSYEEASRKIRPKSLHQGLATPPSYERRRPFNPCSGFEIFGAALPLLPGVLPRAASQAIAVRRYESGATRFCPPGHPGGRLRSLYKQPIESQSRARSAGSRSLSPFLIATTIRVLLPII
jgi:hypothetical protein